MTTLPMWDLTDLFTSFDSKEYLDAPKNIESALKDFEEKRAHLSSKPLDTNHLFESLKAYEEIEVKVLHYYAFARMQYDVDTKNTDAKKAFDSATALLTDVEGKLEWFSQFLKKIPSEEIEKFAHDEKLARYQRFFEVVKLYEKYTLDEKSEMLLISKDRFAQEGWRNMHTELVSHFDFGEIEDEGKKIKMNQSLLKNYLSSPNRDLRKQASKLMKQPFKDTMHILGYTYAQVVSSFEQDSKDVRGYPNGLFRSAMGDEVADSDTKEMIEVIKEYIPLYNEYYVWKKKELGLSEMYVYDMGAPLSTHEAPIPFDTAKDTVLATFSGFSEKFAGLAKQFFDNNWIDAREGGNKYAGAYSWSMYEHPFILLNYQPKIREVFTMIHELGHGVHSLLTQEHQPYLLRNHSKVIAESASQFAELLLLDHYMKTLTDKEEKRNLLSHHIEDLLYCTMSALTVTRFEIAVHEKLANGVLSPEEMCDIWEGFSNEVKGKDIIGTDLDRYAWARIPHIFQTPFYYFTYPMSLLVVLCLYEQYLENPADFIPKYEQFLSLGSSKSPHDMIKSVFGIEFGTKEFYNKGMQVIEKLFIQLKEI